MDCMCCPGPSEEQDNIFQCRGHLVNSKTRFRREGGQLYTYCSHLEAGSLEKDSIPWEVTALKLSPRIMTFAVLWRFRVVFGMSVFLSGSWSSDLCIECQPGHAKMYPRLSKETQLLSFFLILPPLHCGVILWHKHSNTIPWSLWNKIHVIILGKS